ncbi:MAG: glycosyltransferase family 4 protein, partial [Bacteroidota bacterium]
MKFAIICASEAWGGLEINVLNLLRWMQARGHQVLLITFPQARNAQEAAQYQIPTRAFHYKGKHLNFRAAQRLKKILREEAVATLIIGHYTQFYLSVHCKQLMGGRLK